MTFRSKLSPSFLLKSAALFAIFVSFILIIGKAYAYYRYHSLSIQASLLDSLLDMCISTINFFAVRHAIKPADADHGFGHGKAEALAGILQSVFIGFSALWLLKEVYHRFQHPEPMTFDLVSLYVLGGTTILTLILVLWQKFVIKQTDSLAISADCLHYQVDLWVGVGVFLSLFLMNYFQISFIDHLFAGAFSLYILYTAYEIGKKSFDILMDREVDDETLHRIQKIVENFSGVQHLMRCRTRSCGQHIFIHLDIVLDENLLLHQACAVSFHLKQKIKEDFPKTIVMIQMFTTK